MKTLIICHRVVLINQWKKSILDFCPTAKVQILTGTKKVKGVFKPEDESPPDADFYIINACNIHKHPREFYKDIGTLIVDELHIIMAERVSQCMRYLTPRYLIGLSATPYRTDGMDVVINLYFGKGRIIRKLWRKHTVYKIVTGIKPDAELNRMGKVDWNSVINSLSGNKERNEMIVKIVQTFKDRTFLILCKRVNQAEYLVNRLEEEGESVSSLIGKNQTFDKESRVLVGITGKIGVGFDHDRLDSLILATDAVQYFVQYLGRVFRKKDTVPIVFDFLDDFPLLARHFKVRAGEYTDHGGVIRDFRMEFPQVRL